MKIFLTFGWFLWEKLDSLEGFSFLFLFSQIDQNAILRSRIERGKKVSSLRTMVALEGKKERKKRTRIVALE